MSIIEFTGIKKKEADALVSKLDDLLANVQIFYANMRGFHWNIKGKQFFTLHKQFEDQYDYLADKIDEIAERILALGGVPENNFSHYLKISSIKEVSGISCENEIVSSILNSYKTVIAKEREIVSLASDCKDEATVNMFGNYLEDQEKTVWMFASFLTVLCKD
ncbi:MAG: DNA starvation/stationary phase protection protein [Prevotellaceae bacterium]|jgi:starvation-inducible DNA-binding protein|nr:DNA starvation/stationary phase protection protein [Prevotellaceae bacterium]